MRNDSMSREILLNDWGKILENQFNQPYYVKLREFLIQEYNHQTIFPTMHDIFNALHETPFEEVKAVILGQDPYHGPNQAHGLSFSVQHSIPPPPSLKNIFKELHNDLGCPIPNHGHLLNWAKEGVLLLNTVLTVRQGQAHSHREKGWEIFTDEIIKQLNNKNHPIVYILWGRAAQAKQSLIDHTKHFIIKSPHPSPLAAHRGFYGSKPFSKTNNILKNNGLQPINWCNL